MHTYLFLSLYTYAERERDAYSSIPSWNRSNMTLDHFEEDHHLKIGMGNKNHNQLYFHERDDASISLVNVFLLIPGPWLKQKTSLRNKCSVA